MSNTSPVTPTKLLVQISTIDSLEKRCIWPLCYVLCRLTLCQSVVAMKPHLPAYSGTTNIGKLAANITREYEVMGSIGHIQGFEKWVVS